MRGQSTVASPRWLAVLLAALVVLMVGRLAQPAGGLATNVEATPANVVCESAPIDDVRYAEVAADPSDDGAIPDPIPYEPPVGEVAGAVTIDRVEALLGQVVACVNEGRVAAFLSLFTDAWLERHVTDIGERPDDREPSPMADDERLSLVRVADVTVLPDERIAALVVLDQVEREFPELSSLMTFKLIGGQLLIDEWQPVTLLADGATPLPAPCDAETAETAETSDAPSCAPPPAGSWEPVSGEGYAGVIVSLDRAPVFGFGLSPAPSGYWLPDAGLIAELEAGLPGYLRSVDDTRAATMADKVGTYSRQYAGLVVEGRAVIYVNAFCESATVDDRWLSERSSSTTAATASSRCPGSRRRGSSGS